MKVNEFDLAFVIDVTGSMGGLISAAKKNMLDMIKAVKSPSLDMKVAIVAYRDHPPQDNTFVTKVHDFRNPDDCQKIINGLSADGGGDAPEAVFDGIDKTCELKWRKHARRIAILIGDAEPHGLNGTRETKCTCGLTLGDITAKAESQSIRFYAVALTPQALAPFSMICALTGGVCFESRGNQETAIKEVKRILDLEFSDLETDKKVLEIWSPELETQDIATQLGSTSQQILASIGRLRQRELIAV